MLRFTGTPVTSVVKIAPDSCTGGAALAGTASGMSVAVAAAAENVTSLRNKGSPRGMSECGRGQRQPPSVGPDHCLRLAAYATRLCRTVQANGDMRRRASVWVCQRHPPQVHHGLVAGERVLGVDACRAGWVGVALAGAGSTVHVGASIGDLVAAADADGPVEVVAIDIPIGLPDAGRRQADLLARARIGRLWPSVFLTPVRAALLAADHPTAVAVSRERAGGGVSVQAYGLRAKVLQVDRWVRDTDRRVVEVHPEVSFAALAGAPLTERKHTWAGAVRRRRLLAEAAGITLADDIGPAGHGAAVDDVLDAAVVAWTARRVARGDARPLPDPPETFSDGLQAAIWS